MHQQRSLLKTLLLTILVLLAAALTACGERTLVVGLEPTPTPVPSPTPGHHTYVNRDFGFRFDYPETWTLKEEGQRIALSQGNWALTILVGWASNPAFSPMEGRTGMPAGDLSYRGKILFMDKSIPAEVVTFERKDKMVLYGGTGVTTAGSLVFSIWLEDTSDAPYQDVDLPETIRLEAEQILASFEAIEAAGGPPTPSPAPTGPAPTPTDVRARTLVTYENDPYEVAFIYPGTWELTEKAATEDEAGREAPTTIQLRRDGLLFTIQLRRLDEDVVLGPGSRPAGDIDRQDSVTILGQELPLERLIYEGKVKSAFAGGRFGDLELYAQLDADPDTSGAYETIELTETELAEMKAILESLTRTEQGGTSESSGERYENEAYGYAFDYPAGWTIEEVTGVTVEDDVRLADGVLLSRDGFVISLQVQRKSEASQIAWDGSRVTGGMGYGESVLGKPVTLLGEELHQRVWSFDGQVKAISVDTHGEFSDLIVSIQMADGTVDMIQDEEARALPESAIEALDLVLSSFEETG